MSTTRSGLGCVLMLLVATPSWGYVPSTTTKSLKPLRWVGSNCLFLRINSVGSDDITDGSDIKAIEQAVQRWLGVTSNCSYMRFQMLPPAPSVDSAVNKTGLNENTIVWVENGWKEREHEPKAAGITVVSFIDQPTSSRDGLIVDADIELNGELFSFATDGNSKRTDIENTAVHELGHLLGLDHTCHDLSRETHPKDHTGKLIPLCAPSSRLSAEVKDATMYNFALLGETKKRSPEIDDINGVCQSYPIAGDPQVCEQVDLSGNSDGGCAIGLPSPAPHNPWVGLGCVALLLFGLLAAHYRRRTSAAYHE